MFIESPSVAWAAKVFSEELFHGLARMQPGDFVWGNVRYGVVVLLVDVNDPVKAVVELFREQVMGLIVNYRCTLEVYRVW